MKLKINPSDKGKIDICGSVFTLLDNSTYNKNYPFVLASYIYRCKDLDIDKNM